MKIYSYSHIVTIRNDFRSKQPKLEAVGDLVKATSFHDNGKVQQVVFTKMGNYKENGFLDSNGKKQPWQHMIMVRSPKIFLNDTVLSEVDYSNNQIALLKLKHDALVIAE
jgi:hypothetical protein